MKSLLVFREKCKTIYSKYEFIINPVFKFLLAFVSLLVINKQLGYMKTITRVPIVLVVALLCSFMPVNLVLIVSAMFILLHVYALSTAAAVVVGLMMLLLFLLYFRFSPKNTVSVVTTSILWVMKLPFISPIVCGLVCGPAAMVSVGTGTVIYYVLKIIKANEVALRSVSEDDSVLTQFRMLVDAILQNKEMMIAVVAFAITVLLVYLIRRQSMNHAWTIAMVAGAITDCIIIMLGDLLFNTDISVVMMLVGSILAIGCAKVAEFFFFNVDYNRTEYVQFEDDEYYYYVKAVPKNAVAKPEKSVKKVSTATRPIPVDEIRKVRSENSQNRKPETFEKSSDRSNGADRIATQRTVNARTVSQNPRTTAVRREGNVASGSREGVSRMASNTQRPASVNRSSQAVDRNKQSVSPNRTQRD